MKESKQVKETLTNERPASWKEFPDIGLYKDQVVTYVSRQLVRFDDEEPITSAMINNYIKDKLLPRADGKKYSREHLAGLIEICILKQVLSVRDIGFLLQQVMDESTPELFYEKFIGDVNQSLTQIAEYVEEEWCLQDLPDIALRMAISCYCSKLVCERLIDIIRSSASAEENKKKEKPDIKLVEQHENKQEYKKETKERDLE